VILPVTALSFAALKSRGVWVKRREFRCFAGEVRLLLQHQAWLWGKDVRCPAGNRLVAGGFARIPAAVDCADSVTTYRLNANGHSLLLWSYGVAVLAPDWRDALFLERATGEVYALSRVSFVSHLWSYDDLTEHLRPAGEETVANAPILMRWIGDYERSVQERIGIEARERELAEWKLAKRLAGSLPAAWDELAARWTACFCPDLDALPAEEVKHKATDVDKKGVAEQPDAENSGDDHDRVDAVSPFFGPVDILEMEPEREFVER
jgi:hypothetical protein